MDRLRRSLMPRTILRPVIVLIVAGTILTSCSANRLRLTSGAGSCFAVLPVAQRAVSPGDRYLGVRLVDSKTAENTLSMSISSNESNFCLVAYRLEQPGSSPGLHQIGRFALVIVSPKTRQVIGEREVSRLPFSFRHNLSVRL
ncbi:MAG: hypothetical protein M0Z96_00445 [Actinomycetota bacterium]|nr:hypothetical protein [Actinomycetota bacterium]